jgi:cytochrome c-type biogenesis protein CcmF
VLVLGLAGATAGSDRTASLTTGEAATVGGVVVRNDGVRTDPGVDGNPRVIARLVVDRGGRERVLEPEIVGYPDQGVRLAETALWSDPTGDVQLALRTADDDGRVLLDVHVRPLTPLVWWGASILALGGTLSALAGRRNPDRLATPVEAPSAQRR